MSANTTPLTKADVVAGMLAAFETRYGSDGLTFAVGDWDFELVFDDAGARSVDGTIWEDDINGDPVEVAKVRLTVQVLT